MDERNSCQDQRSEVRDQRSEVRSQRSEIRDQKSDASTLDAKHLQRFKNEAYAAAQLHHTNIVPVFATGC